MSRIEIEQLSLHVPGLSRAQANALAVLVRQRLREQAAPMSSVSGPSALPGFSIRIDRARGESLAGLAEQIANEVARHLRERCDPSAPR